MADMSKINFNIDGVNNEYNIKDKVARNNNAINRTTLGTQKKNLLSVSEGSATRLFEKTINQIEPGNYILSFGEVMSTDTDKNECLCFFSDSYNTQKSNTISLKRGTNISVPVTINEPVTKIRVYASNDWNNSADDTITVSNAMLRYVDITDDTYEPYKPSIDTRLTNAESDILSVSNDTEINSLTLGTKVAKNLFNKDGQINVRYNGVIESNEGKMNTVNNNIVTFNTSTSTDKGTGQIIRGLKNKKVIISCECVSVGTSSSNKGKLIIYKLNSGTELAYEFIELGDFVFEYDCGDNDELLFAFVVNGSGAGLQLKNIMIRSAEFANHMYVPYSTPTLSLQEQINDNTMDILTAKNDTALASSTLGISSYYCKNIFDYAKWESSINSVDKGTFEKHGDGITISANAYDAYTSQYAASHTNICKIPVKPNTKYILSWESDNDNDGKVYIFKNAVSSSGEFSNNKYEKSLDFETNSNTTFITVRFGVMYAGESITYSNIMIREADIIDDTYEPYTPSIDTRLTSAESDILSLYQNSHNRGIASAKSNPNKWYKIGEYTSNVTLNTTLLITSRYLDIQGLLTLTANISSTSNGTVWGSTALKTNWLGLRTITDNRNKYNVTDIFKFGGTLTNGILHCELWVKIPTSWDIFSTVILHPNQNISYPWEILSTETAFDNYPEFEKISSPTDMLFDFETRLEALETALAQIQTQ